MPSKILGQGSYGVVVKIKDRTHGYLAVKILPTWNDDFCREAEIGKILDHKNIVKCFDYGLKNNPKGYRKLLRKKFKKQPIGFFLVQTQYCNFGSLQEWLISLKLSRTLESAENLFSQIIDGVEYLHKNHIVHGDLKPHNIFLHHTNNDQLIIKIGDFGESSSTAEEKLINNQHGGTPLYQNIPKDKLTWSYDIYSLGLIYAILFMGSFFKFDKYLISTEIERKYALQNLLVKIKSVGCSLLVKNTHPKRERMIAQMLGNEERPDAFKVKTMFNEMREMHTYLGGASFPGRNPTFQGRQKILQEIKDIHDKEIDCPFVLLHGLTGTGKKSIAAEYLHSISESNSIVHICWIKADRRSSVEKRLKKLKETTDHMSVIEWLQSQPKLALVYENVNSFTEIKDLLPTKMNNGLLICTSRIQSGDWPQIFTKIKVDQLTKKECVNFVSESFALINTKGRQYAPAKSYSEQLAQRMGFLGTAVNQSLAFIKHRKCTEEDPIIDFIKYHDKNFKTFQKNNLQKLLKFKNTDNEPIYTAVNSMINGIQREDKKSFDWLRICAYLHQENIPEFVFDNFLELFQSSDSKSTILDRMNSFMTFKHNDNATFNISPLVQQVIQISRISSFEDTFALIYKVLKFNGKFLNKRDEEGRILKLRLLTPHYESLVVHLENYEDYKKSSGINCLSNKASEQIFLKMKFSLIKGLQKCYKSLTLKHQQRETNEKLLMDKEVLFGANSFACGTTLMAKGKNILRVALGMSNGSSNRSANRMDGSSEQQSQFLWQINRAICELLKAKNVLQQCYENDGRKYIVYQCYLYLGDCYHYRQLSNRRKCDDRSEYTDEREYLINHTDAKLAFEYFQMALTILVQGLKNGKRMHLATGRTLESIARVFKFLQAYDISEYYLLLAFVLQLDEKSGKCVKDCRFKNELVLDKLSEMIKPSNILQVVNNTASYNVSFGLMEQILMQYNENPVAVSGILKSLVACYKSGKITGEKPKLAATILQACKEQLKRDNGMAATSKTNATDCTVNDVGNLGFKDNDIEDTIDNDCSITDSGNKNANKSMKNDQDKNAKNGKNKNIMANRDENEISDEDDEGICKVVKPFEKASNLRNKAQLAEEKIVLAKALKRNFKIPEALQMYQEALQLYLQHRHMEDMSVAYVYEYIGECYVLLGDNSSACEMYEKCYQITDKDQVIVKHKNRKFADLIKKYVKVLPLKKTEKKINLMKKCLSIVKVLDGEKHNDVGFMSEKLGSLLLQKEEYFQAEAFLREALGIYKTNLPPGNQNRISCLKKLLQVYDKLVHCSVEAETYKKEYAEESTATPPEGFTRKITMHKALKHKEKLKKRTEIRNKNLNDAS